MAVDQRLPRVGDDDGVWGDILRQYLMKEHYNDDNDNPDNGGHQFVTIRPGTTSAPPLQLTAGSLTTVAAVGAIEFNDGKLYFTTTGSVRKTVAMYDTSGADGDLFYRNSTGTLSRLPIGNTNDVLTVSGGMPIWQPNGAANAVLKSDTATTGYGFVVDEDNMTSNSATKVPTQQSVKAYVDSSISSVDLSSKENVITAGSTAQYWRGDKSWQTLDKTAVGLANVDNTADANKSVASAATLTTARTIQTNLGSTAAASFNGSANVSPGVTGTLPVSNGGTGATSLTSGNVLVGGGTGAVTATKAAPSGAFVGTTDTQTLSAKRINPRSVAPSVASSYTIDSDATDFYTVTGQNQNATFNNPTGTPVDGQKLMVRIKDDGTSRLVGWGSNFRASGITGPLAQTVPGKEHNVLFVYSTGVSKWVCLASDAVGY